MNLLAFLIRTKEKEKTSNFANFFLHASDKEKKRVFEDAARRANEDQRMLVESANKLRKTTLI